MDRPHVQVSDADAGPRRGSEVRTVALAGALMLAVVAGLAGWLGFRAHQSEQADQQRRVFLEVGRQGAVNLTTIDFHNAEADVQRIADSATGKFYDDFTKRAGPFVDAVKQAKSSSQGSVTGAALESETPDSAEVLVSVAVKSAMDGVPEKQPRLWRMRISVQQVGDRAKVADVEFVP